jgi:hypothetical protein
MKRTVISGIAIAAALAVIATIATQWRPHRATTLAPIASSVVAPAAPPPAVTAQTAAATAEPVPAARPEPPAPRAARTVVVAPPPPAPTQKSEEPSASSERPDLTSEESNQAKAVDLFADKTLQLEDKFSDDPAAEEAPETRSLHDFRDREEDEKAPDSEREIGDHLREWMATFPPEVADRLVLVSVECRLGACRILLAEVSIDMQYQATSLGTTAMSALFAQAWWQQDFVSHDVTTEVVPDHPGATDGHALLTLYATRTSTTQ